MPSAFKVVRDSAISWPVPGGGVTWAANVYAENDSITLEDDNGEIGFTVGKTGTYAIALGRNESIGTADGGIFTTMATYASGTVALVAGTQYYAQGPVGGVRTVQIMLGYRLSANSSEASDTGTVSIRGLDAGGADLRETLTLTGTTNVASTNYYAKIVSITKDETAGFVTISDTFNYRMRLSPKQRESRWTRIEFDSEPTDAAIMSVVYKKRVREMEADGDSPQISGIDNSIMAMALGDLYTRNRQLSKAAVKYQEGVSLLEVVRSRESVQQAQSIVLVPEHLGGYQCNDFGWV